MPGIENLRKQMQISMSSQNFQSSEGDILNVKLARNQTCCKKKKKGINENTGEWAHTYVTLEGQVQPPWEIDIVVS